MPRYVKKVTRLAKNRRVALIGHLQVLKEQGLTKPKVRRDCANVTRPCPYVSCKYNNFLDIEANGSIRFNFPGVDVLDVPNMTFMGIEFNPSCVLDIVDRFQDVSGSDSMLSNAEIGSILGVSKETIRLLNISILRNLRETIENLPDTEKLSLYDLFHKYILDKEDTDE